MKIIQICPACGMPGVKVNNKAVKYNLKKSARSKGDDRLSWNACLNPACDCSYFERGRELTTADLVKPLFYKNSTDNVPICYCSDISRGEIKEAVKNGSKTISEVHKFTKKNKTGSCEKKNPMGKCCKQAFMRTINDNIEIVKIKK